MPPKSEDTSPVPRQASLPRIYMSVGGIGILILAIISYGFYIGNRLTSLDAPMVSSAAEIKLEATIAGLMIEEILNDGIVGGIEENWEPLDTAINRLKQLSAHAQADWKTALLPFQRPGIQSDIDELERKKKEWESVSNRRARDEQINFLQDNIEILYKEVFFEFMYVVKRLEDRLRSNLSENVDRFRYTQVVLFLGCLGLTLLAGIVVFRFEAQRARNEEKLLIAGARLTAEVEERRRTARALAERTEALEQSNQDLQQFAYVASHDLQEPLRMVSSYVKLLQRRYSQKLDADADDFIGFAVDGAARMQKMIRDLLSYSRVGTTGNPQTRTDTREVLLQAVANLKMAIEESGARVTHTSMPVITADPTQVCQLFQNLIANAIKFRREIPPAIHISAKRDGRWWVFSVRDNGIGFDSEFADRVFTIFQRLHAREDYPGTGMGLAICKRVVERHGGSIRVESEPDRGSTFLFTLPANEDV